MKSLTAVPTPVTHDPIGEGCTIDIGRGSHLVLEGRHGSSPYEVFMMALMGSVSRDGKPVRCTNFVRGVSLLLDSATPPVAGPGANLEAALGDARTSPFELIDDALALVHSHLNFDPDDRANLHLITTTSVSVPMQAFWLRKGALFEPTDALEQLLKLSDVGDDMPLAAVACGARTLCIVPGPSLRHGPDGIDSITVFDHTGLPTGAVSERWLTFIAAKVRTSDEDELMAPVLRIILDDETMTIREAVQRYCIAGKGAPVGDAAGRDFWTRVLSYAFKILFYLSSEQPQITQDNAYSNAPRNFSGLGKRRKSERLREIEQLYDRYIVGPEILPSLHERGAVHDGTGEGGEVSPHWRRGHFRLQRHGPGRARTRVVFIMPIIVRADRLKSDSLR